MRGLHASVSAVNPAAAYSDSRHGLEGHGWIVRDQRKLNRLAVWMVQT